MTSENLCVRDRPEIPVRYHKPFRFMLLERQEKENKTKAKGEPNFHPRFRRTLPPGLDVKQPTSLGIGNLTRLPVYADQNEILSTERYRERVPDQLQMKQSRYFGQTENWQSAQPLWNDSGIRPTTGTFLQNYKRRSLLPRELTAESKLLRFHSASYERAIPGYAGSRNCQPKYARQITRVDNPYGTKYNDLSSLQHTANFKRSGTFSRMVTVLPPHNPFANTSSTK